jgi:hypothetical protein
MVQFRLARNWVAISPTCAWMLVLAAAAVGGSEMLVAAGLGLIGPVNWTRWEVP